MSHHLIDISAASCTITCKHGQLICRPENEPERSVPMEDVGAVLISSFSALVHNRVFLEAARHGTVIVFCENFRPSGILLPANRATDTLLTRAQLRLTDAVQRTLWHKTVTAKCINQAAFAKRLDVAHLQTERLARIAGGPRTDKESNCARLYWRVLSERLEMKRFKRTRQEEGLNSLLNYGYAVLLARMLQKMLAVGIDPVFGIGHAVRERATPLAYDLMEPFRVAVDARVVAWVEGILAQSAQRAESGEDGQPIIEVSREYKKWVQRFLETQVPYEKRQIKVEHLIEHVLHGFREAVLAKRPGLYKPWTLGSTKWDGSL